MRSKSHLTWVRGLKRAIHSHYFLIIRSHLTWVRGLKHKLYVRDGYVSLSHLTWVRGLKQNKLLDQQTRKSRTLRGCVG